LDKIPWKGIIHSVQPRIRLMRSFDERSHSYLGYCLYLSGELLGQQGEFSIGIGKAAYQKHQFQVGDEVSGISLPVQDDRKEPVGYYKTSKLTVLNRIANTAYTPPPYHFVAVSLEEYRERGHRRLSTRTYDTKCRTCVWGCRMPVEMIVDHWKPHIKKYRFETFCYGPKVCKIYSAGPTRIVPGRQGMTWEEPDWVDEEATAHRKDND